MEGNKNRADSFDRTQFHVVLDTTTICNLRCRQCFHSLYSVHRIPYRQHEMPPALFEKILTEFSGHMYTLAFSCSAEPFTNQDFHRYLALVRRHVPPSIPKRIATNGLLINEALARDLIETGLDSLIISMDGARRESYNAIRRGGDFDRLMARLDLLNRLKDEKGSERPELTFNVTLTRSNLEELPLFVELAHEKKVAEVSFQHLVPFRGLNLKHEALFYENRRKVRQVFDRTRKRAAELGVRLGNLLDIPGSLQCFGTLLADMVRRWIRPRDGNYCNLAWQIVVFNSRGDVFPCFCWGSEPPMGNLRKQAFREIWESERYQRLRAELGGFFPLRQCCLDCSHMGRRKLTRRSFREQDFHPELASPIPAPGEDT